MRGATRGPGDDRFCLPRSDSTRSPALRTFGPRIFGVLRRNRERYSTAWKVGAGAEPGSSNRQVERRLRRCGRRPTVPVAQTVNAPTSPSPSRSCPSPSPFQWYPSPSLTRWYPSPSFRSSHSCCRYPFPSCHRSRRRCRSHWRPFPSPFRPSSNHSTCPSPLPSSSTCLSQWRPVAYSCRDRESTRAVGREGTATRSFSLGSCEPHWLVRSRSGRERVRSTRMHGSCLARTRTQALRGARARRPASVNPPLQGRARPAAKTTGDRRSHEQLDADAGDCRAGAGPPARSASRGLTSQNCCGGLRVRENAARSALDSAPEDGHAHPEA